MALSKVFFQMLSLFNPRASTLRQCDKSHLRYSRHIASASGIHHAKPLQLIAASPSATQLLAHYFAASLHPGDCYLLYGDVGAGKSHFSRAFVQAALKDEDLAVPSPTFLLQNIYEIGGDTPPVYHCDLYRLTHSADLARLNLEGFLSTAVSLIEWAERLGSERTPHHHLALKLDIVSGREQANLEAARGTLFKKKVPFNASGSGDQILGEEEEEEEEEERVDSCVEGDAIDMRWRRIGLVAHGPRWEQRLDTLRQHVGARGEPLGLFLVDP